MPSHYDFSWPSLTKLAEYAGDDQLWNNYLNTKVLVDTATAVGTVWPSDGSNDQTPLEPFHVITAIQPNSDPTSADNAARLELLDSELHAAGIRSTPAVGSSFDDEYREVSRAVFGLTDDGARTLGVRFGQVAVFSLQGQKFSLIACANGRRTDRGWRWEPGGPSLSL
ncbi:DUF3293 domain-containing protein [Gordonia terrae]